MSSVNQVQVAHYILVILIIIILLICASVIPSFGPIGFLAGIGVFFVPLVVFGGLAYLTRNYATCDGEYVNLFIRR